MVRQSNASPRERGVENDVMRQVIKAGVGRQWRTALVCRFILVKCMEENVSNKHDINLCEARTSIKWLEVQSVSFFYLWLGQLSGDVPENKVFLCDRTAGSNIL